MSKNIALDTIINEAAVQKQFEKLAEYIKTYENAIVSVNESVGKIQAPAGMKDFTDNQKKHTAALSEAEAMAKKVDAAQRAYNLSLTEGNKKILELKVATRDNNVALQLEIALRKVAKDSIVAYEKEALSLEKTLKKMGATERDSAKGMDMQRKLEKLRDVIRSFEAATGNFRPNVGNYPQMFKSLGAAAGSASDAMGGMNNVFSQASSLWKGVSETGNGFTKILGGMFIAAGVVAGSVMALSKGFDFFKSVMHSTKDTADAFQKKLTQIEWAYGSLLRTIATGDWSNLIKNMDDAITKGAQYFDILDEVEKRQRSFDMLDSERQNRIFDLRKKQKDATIGTLEQAKAGLAIMHEENEGLGVQDKLKRRLLDAAKLKASTETGLADFQVIAYQKNLEQNLSLVKNGEKYNALLKEEASLQGKVNAAKDADTRSEFKSNLIDVQTQIKNTSSFTKVYADIIAKMGKAKPETLEELKTAYANVGLAAVNMKQGALKSLTAFNNDLAQMTKAEQDKQKQAVEDYKKLTEEQKQAKEDLWKDLVALEQVSLQEQLDHEIVEMMASKKYAVATEEQKLQLIGGLRNKYNDKELEELKELEDKKLKVIADAKALQAKIEQNLAGVGKSTGLFGIPTAKGVNSSTEADAPQIRLEDLTKDQLESELEQHEKYLRANFKLEDQYSKDLIAEINKRKKAEKDTYITLAREAVNVANELGGLLNETYQADQEKYKIAADAKKQALQDQLDRGVISKTNFDAQIKKIDRQLAHDQAVSQKKQADIVIAMALVNTAAQLGISIASAIGGATSAGAETGPAAPITTPVYIIEMVGAVIAGFLSVWSAISKAQSIDIPSYKTGRKGGPEELAAVHKGEIIELGSSASYVADDTLARLPLGASVLTANEVRRDYLNKSMAGITGNYRHDSTLDTLPIVRELQNVASKLDNQKQLIVNIDKHGFRTSLRNGQVHENWINNRVRL